MTFGTLASGEVSQAIIVSLNVPDVKAIAHIKLGLISIGNMEFNNEMFGVEANNELAVNYTPTEYFQGINTDGLSTSAYNIDISNRNQNSSAYVYLNINVPLNNIPDTYVLRYKWFFDFAE